MTVAAVVIRTGLSLVPAASMMAPSLSFPVSWRWFANCTMRMPFYAMSPTSVMSPTWL